MRKNISSVKEHLLALHRFTECPAWTSDATYDQMIWFYLLHDIII